MTFWGPNGLFLGLGKGSKTVFGSSNVVEQLSFSMLLYNYTGNCSKDLVENGFE